MSLLVDNRDLLDRFRRGEQATLTTVFRHYAPVVARLLRRGFGFDVNGRHVRFRGITSTFDLEDALQEVFRRAFSEHARTTYDGLRPFAAYLATIARNSMINLYTANLRRLERYGFEEFESAPQADEWSAADDALDLADRAPSGHPERDAQMSELCQIVREFRDTLDERERNVFALRFDEGLSHTDIAARTGLSAAKIKTAESRIRKELLRTLHRRGYLERFHQRALYPDPGAHALQGEAS